MYKKRNIFFACALVLSVAGFVRGLLYVLAGNVPDFVTIVTVALAAYCFYKYKNITARLAKGRASE
jgi:hypothetical protein